MTRSLAFNIEERAYEIRIWSEGSWQLVQAFVGGDPVSLRYGVFTEVAADLATANGGSAVQHLVDAVKDELRRKSS